MVNAKSHGEQSAAQGGGYGFRPRFDTEPHEERPQRHIDLTLAGAELMCNFVEGNASGETLQHRPFGRRNMQYDHRFLPEK